MRPAVRFVGSRSPVFTGSAQPKVVDIRDWRNRAPGITIQTKESMEGSRHR